MFEQFQVFVPHVHFFADGLVQGGPGQAVLAGLKLRREVAFMQFDVAVALQVHLSENLCSFRNGYCGFSQGPPKDSVIAASSPTSLNYKFCQVTL